MIAGCIKKIRNNSLFLKSSAVHRIGLGASIARGEESSWHRMGSALLWLVRSLRSILKVWRRMGVALLWLLLNANSVYTDG